MEELEHALKKYNMGDEKTIKEIIAEVDTDNVWILSLLHNRIRKRFMPVLDSIKIDLKAGQVPMPIL